MGLSIYDKPILYSLSSALSNTAKFKNCKNRLSSFFDMNYRSSPRSILEILFAAAASDVFNE